MRKYALIVLSLLIGFSAVAKHKHKKKAKALNDIRSVSMRRTGCYGRCPSYMIALADNGMATYTGFRFVDDTGVFKKSIGTSAAAAILKKISDNRVDTCQDEYISRVTDIPGMIITIQYSNTTKTIQNANLGPSVLRQLAEALDGIATRPLDNTWHR